MSNVQEATAAVQEANFSSGVAAECGSTRGRTGRPARIDLGAHVAGPCGALHGCLASRHAQADRIGSYGDEAVELQCGVRQPYAHAPLRARLLLPDGHGHRVSASIQDAARMVERQAGATLWRARARTHSGERGDGLAAHAWTRRTGDQHRTHRPCGGLSADRPAVLAGAEDGKGRSGGVGSMARRQAAVRTTATSHRGRGGRRARRSRRSGREDALGACADDGVLAAQCAACRVDVRDHLLERVALAYARPLFVASGSHQRFRAAERRGGGAADGHVSCGWRAFCARVAVGSVVRLLVLSGAELDGAVWLPAAGLDLVLRAGHALCAHHAAPTMDTARDGGSQSGGCDGACGALCRHTAVARG
ncbi:hypothetical protein L1887_60328 [Cichorium endivia]|nr:hypothetical protein L1887_60328 [Cichorium endivia]